jgi:hypothetical protein
MKSGLLLRELRLRGPNIEDAVIEFGEGLNVVAGPSDTGKTYIAQCLSFLVGNGKTPKEIPEARAYATACVVLAGRGDGVKHTLTRLLDGSGSVQHTVGDRPARTLRAQHDPERSDTLPAFLLALSGLSDRKVRMRVYGQTRPLNFRDVARLFVVDEETVINQRSPAMSGQHNHQLVERRVFRLLLTGRDDSNVVALDKPEVARSRRAGRIEVLEELASTIRVDLGRLGVEGSAEEAERRAGEWGRRAEAAATELERAQQAATPVAQQRREAMGELRRVRSLIEHRGELQTRFELLREQYESDLERLAIVEQAGGRLEQLTEQRCPVCGAVAEHQQHDHRHEHVDAGAIAESCRAEADKIGLLIRDLDATIAANTDQLAQLGAQAERHDQALADNERELASVLHPRVGEAARALRESERKRGRALRAAGLLRRATEINALLAEAKTTAVLTRAEGSTDGASAADAEAFTSRVESLLRSWHFPDVERVTWSERDQDIVVSGRGRASFGKGKRAIMRAAFNLALLRVLADEQRPSPGFVLIDSPLVVYREPDAEEKEFPLAVKEHFYEAVARDFTDLQVILFENDAPPTSVVREANVTVFTGSDVGRRGFIP